MRFFRDPRPGVRLECRPSFLEKRKDGPKESWWALKWFVWLVFEDIYFPPVLFVATDGPCRVNVALKKQLETAIENSAIHLTVPCACIKPSVPQLNIHLGTRKKSIPSFRGTNSKQSLFFNNCVSKRMTKAPWVYIKVCEFYRSSSILGYCWWFRQLRSL